MKNKVPSIRKNLLYSTFFQMLSLIMPFITAPYISRVLGPDGVGIQSYTASCQAYFSLFAALGTTTYGAREISRARDDTFKCSKLFWEIELLTIVTSSISLCAWFFFIALNTKYRSCFIVLSLNILATMFDISWFFSGLEKFDLIVIRNTFFRISGIVLTFIFVKSKDDLLIYILLTSMTAVLSSLSMWPYLPQFVIRVPLRKLSLFFHFRETLIYFIPTIATSVYSILDKTLIGVITQSTVENGYYQQADKIILMAKSLVFTSVNSVVGVRISYLFAENKIDEIHERIENSLNYILFLGVGAAFGIMGIAKKFVPVFFGKGYGNVEYLLYILSPIIVVIGVSNCLGSHYYTPCGKRMQSTKYIIAGSALNFCMNLFLIPFLNSYGAAIASVTAELLITILYVRFSNGFVTLSCLCRCGIKKIFAGLVMFGLVLLIGRIKIPEIFGLSLQICTGLLIYILILIVVGDTWTKNLIISSIKIFREKARGR